METTCGRIPLDMPIEHYIEHDNAAPASLRPHLTRAYSYAMFPRWHEITARECARKARFAPQLVAQAPTDGWGNAGRNYPSPCGSARSISTATGGSLESVPVRRH
jgi:hypothetical protein